MAWDGRLEIEIAIGSRVDSQTEFEAARRAARDSDPMFYEKLSRAKRSRQEFHPS